MEIWRRNVVADWIYWEKDDAAVAVEKVANIIGVSRQMSTKRARPWWIGLSHIIYYAMPTVFLSFFCCCPLATTRPLPYSKKQQNNIPATPPTLAALDRRLFLGVILFIETVTRTLVNGWDRYLLRKTTVWSIIASHCVQRRWWPADWRLCAAILLIIQSTGHAPSLYCMVLSPQRAFSSPCCYTHVILGYYSGMGITYRCIKWSIHQHGMTSSDVRNKSPEQKLI